MVQVVLEKVCTWNDTTSSSCTISSRGLVTRGKMNIFTQKIYEERIKRCTPSTCNTTWQIVYNVQNISTSTGTRFCAPKKPVVIFLKKSLDFFMNRATFFTHIKIYELKYL